MALLMKAMILDRECPDDDRICFHSSCNNQQLLTVMKANSDGPLLTCFQFQFTFKEEETLSSLLGNSRKFSSLPECSAPVHFKALFSQDPNNLQLHCFLGFEAFFFSVLSSRPTI